MARRSYLHLEEQEDPELDMAPLIDVSFLLLIYFLVTSTMQPKEGDLNITFPATQTDQVDVPPVDPLSVHLREDGVILAGIGGAEEELEADINSRKCPRLLEKLREYKSIADATGSTPFVVVRADDAAKQQRFIDIVNTLSIVEISNVTITGFRED
ncbi:MAG: biopolymer transport protein ExbD [Verrucomicrobiales bacterium]|jgi:biopolymer transport protein ExbD